MLVLGIDPGTATTGYGLVAENADGSLMAVKYGIISTPAGLPLSERLLMLRCQLKEILLLHRPDSCAVEKLFFARNVTTALAVGEARGVTVMTLAEARLEVGEYTPLEVKQAVAGYGRAEKSQVQQMVQILLGMDRIPKPDDAADALAVAICHLQTAKYRSKMTSSD